MLALRPEEMGISKAVTTPASVSNERLPVIRLFMVVEEVYESNVRAFVPPNLNMPALSTCRSDPVDEPIEKLELPAGAFTDSIENGEVVPIPTFPLLLRMVSAGIVVLAKVVGEDVEMYRFPPAFRKLQ